MTEKCPRCGAELTSESVFCSKCGASTKPLTRPVTMTVASIVFAVFGALEIVSAISLFMLFIASWHLDSMLAVWIFVILGVASLMIASLDVAACCGLLRMKRWGAILGMLTCFFGIFTESVKSNNIYGLLSLFWRNSLDQSAYLFASSFAGTSIWVYIMLLVLIAISWKSFEH